jgi:hypothetical protein
MSPSSGGKRSGLTLIYSYRSLSLLKQVLESLGHPDAAKRRLEAIAEIMELQATEEVRVLGQELIRRNALPANAEIDAYHVAIATVNGIEYLLTWNCTHIANAHTRPKIEATCRALGYEPPIICTPQELTEEV